MPNFKFPIVRSDDELSEAFMRAQVASFRAEDEGEKDDEADAIYRFCQWMTGNSNADPTEGMGDEEDDEAGDLVTRRKEKA